MPIQVAVKSLSKTYPNGKVAVNKVSFEVEKGEFIGLLGSSGSGKSTLLRCVNGFEIPFQGEVEIGETRVTERNIRKIRSEVGMIFQNFCLVPRLNVLTNVAVGRLAHIPAFWSLLYLFPKEDLEIATEALDSVGLLSYAYEPANKLSGGQQQRVAIARSLAQRPKVILADEPVASLDPTTGSEVMELLRARCTERGVTVLCSLHHVDLAKRFCDRIIGLKNGEVVLDMDHTEISDQNLESLYGQGLPG